jgi:hypothetical protein
MKVLLPLTLGNHKDFNLEGKTLVYKNGMVVVNKDISVNGTVLRVNGEVLEVFLHNNEEVYLISEV